MFQPPAWAPHHSVTVSSAVPRQHLGVDPFTTPVEASPESSEGFPDVMPTIAEGDASGDDEQAETAGAEAGATKAVEAKEAGATSAAASDTTVTAGHRLQSRPWYHAPSPPMSRFAHAGRVLINANRFIGPPPAYGGPHFGGPRPGPHRR